ncbi:TRAP transporter substrate-binding protein [Methylobacterium oryzisoli]|uniref:TRAP transporter substrate-binding protein n=1 Tax=Methylobacterium oryzisoli TaxID=3385502 RepID=UPI003892A1EE
MTARLPAPFRDRDETMARPGPAAWRRALALLRGGALAVALLCAGAAPEARAEPPIRLKIVGGLAGVRQFTQFEEPFWSRTIGVLSGGRIEASIHSFDRSGLRGQDMLQVMRLGVVPFGTAIVSVVAGDDPELSAIDLPGLSPDTAALRRTVEAYRPHLAALLQERYGIELLGVYAYPAQVLYCAKPFRGLDDLAGRRVRTSSVNQSEWIAALGAVPVITPFAEMVGAITKGVAECAITGTLSGAEVGLTRVTSHVHGMAIGWGVSIFGANRAAWEALAPDLRETVRRGVADLERSIWQAAEQDTVQGLACISGAACEGTRRAGLTLVVPSPADEARRRRLLVETVLPGWIERCGDACAEAWNGTIAASLGIRAGAR